MSNGPVSTGAGGRLPHGGDHGPGGGDGGDAGRDDAADAGARGGKFDRGYLAQLAQCMDTLDPELASTSDGAWRGIITYHDTDGAGRRTHSPDLNPIYKRTYKVQN